MTTKIAIERDWVLVIAKYTLKKLDSEANQDDEQPNSAEFKKKLANINATVRRFDLTTSILAPLFAGVIMSFLKISPSLNGTVISAIVFAVWNIISYLIENLLLTSVYNDIPELKKDKEPKTPRAEDEVEQNTCLKVLYSIKKGLVGTGKGWSKYLTQGLVLMPSIALAVLYLTVLSFDSITIGYAKSQKLTESFISMFQGVGSVFGILGTVGFQIMHNKLKINLPYIGLIGCTYQLTFLFVCFSAIWLPGIFF